jgi:hypothetical protein
MPASESIFAKFLDPEKEPSEIDPAAELLRWLTFKWRGDTITLRDVYRHGPHFLRNDRESAFSLAEALVRQGRLVALKPHRRDAREWHVIREPIRK